MARSRGGRRRRTTSRKEEIKSDDRLKEKLFVQQSKDELEGFSKSSSMSSNEFEQIKAVDFNQVDVSNSSCSTPKAKRFRIPEISTCPPAPKKQRLVSNFSLKRSHPISFFASPDIEPFFVIAFRDVSF